MRGDLAMVPLYMYMIIIVFCLPVTNFITGSEGIFRINCFVVFYFIFRRRKMPRRVLPLAGRRLPRPFSPRRSPQQAGAQV